MTHDLRLEIDHIYDLRRSRAEHPAGKFDKAGRWYPDGEELQNCCPIVRSPSRQWPYSFMTHCRTREHITNLVISRHLAECEICRVVERLGDNFSVETAPVVTTTLAETSAA